MKRTQGIILLLLALAAVIGLRLRSLPHKPVEATPPAVSGEAAAKPKPILVSPDTASPLEWGMSQGFLRRGTELLEEGRIGAAIEKISDAIAADPGNTQAYITRGNIFWRIGRMDLAIQDLTAAIDLSGQRPFFVTRCTAYFVSGFWDAAIDDCSEAVRLGPTETDAYLLRAMTYYAKGDLRSALRDGLVVLMIHPNDPNARHLVDEILAQMEEKPNRDYVYEGLPVIKTEAPAGR